VGLTTALCAFAKTQWRTALRREGSVINCRTKSNTDDGLWDKWHCARWLRL